MTTEQAATAPPVGSRTALAPLAIACPSWCVRTAEEYAADLWNNEGRCIHISADVEVTDATGWSTYGEPTRFNRPATIFLTSSTTPEGRETESALFHLNGQEMSADQVLALSDELRRQVELYRSTGGVA